ncbi:MAG: polysaccharide biosynthesis protein, partial [Clostridia bacterium]|nr:polysaccharide biosynthesis protein [Clostridia bacterium]
MKKTQSFAIGALVLMIASIATKIIGAIFKIPLTNLIGADGMGVFGVAYTIYSTLFVISTAGLPIAISKMVAEANAVGNHKRIKSILKVSLLSFSVIGILASFIMVIFAEPLTNLVGNTLAYYAVLAIAPSLFFVSIVSIIRGFYQGLSDMVPTAVSQVLESAGKLGFGLLFAYILQSRGYSFEICAAGAILGVTLGTLMSAIYLFIIVGKKFKEYKNIDADEPFVPLAKSIVKMAVPVTVGSAVLSLTNLIDMFLVMNRLQSAAGFSEMMANKLYGAYNMSVTLYNLPQTFVVAISVSIIPAISSFIAQNNRIKTAETIGTAFKLASMIAFPAGIGFLILSKPILNLLYYSKPEDVVIAAPLLSYLGIAVMFIALVSLSNSVLQAIGKINVPVFTMLVGGIVKIAANYILVGQPDVNINGAPIGTMCCYGVIAILNLIVIKKNYKEVSIVKMFSKTFVSAVVMGIFAYLMINPVSAYLGQKLGVV